MNFVNDVGKVATTLGFLMEAVDQIAATRKPLPPKLVASCRSRVQEAHEALVRIGMVTEDTAAVCKQAIVNARFGPPSSWGGDRPKGWHLDRPCTPEEACMHDNGCNDAFAAVAKLYPAKETTVFLREKNE